MGRIFLSYARKDRGFAERLARLLEQAGHEVWWDHRIDGGDEFAAEIEAELDKANAVVVVWSKTSVKSRWVRDEAASGGDSGRLIPVSIDGVRPPMGFRQFHTIDLAGWKGGARDARTAELVRSVSHRIDGIAAAIPASAASGSPPRRGRIKGRRLWAGLAVLAVLLAAAVAATLLRSNAAAGEPASLAVLPFKNMASGDPYFAEGVAEEIADRLSREPQFKVAGRTSSALFKDAADFRDVGRRLHVAYVLEGSVRSAGRLVRVNVALVDTSNGMRLWNQDFRGSLNDIFAIQDEIGQQVAAHVKRQLIPKVRPSTMKTSGEVYSLYVTARSLMNLREPAKIEAAADLLRTAVKADPNYAPAWAQFALATQLTQFYGHENEEGTNSPRAESLRAAERAVALAPGFARGRAILGLLLSNQKAAPEQQRRGRAELERSVELDPHDAEAWYWLHGLRKADIDFEGALEALEHSAHIDPFFVFSSYYPTFAWDMNDHQGATGFLARRARDHPAAYIREQARAQLAGLQNDWSAQYAHFKAARDIAPPDMKSYDEGRMGIVLMSLGLFGQAERYVPVRLVDLRRGRFTFPGGFKEAFPGAEFWNFNADEEHLLPRVLVKLGRSRELASVFDEAFSSPQDMATRYPRYGFVINAPLLAISLHNAGRGREGVRILFLADAMCGTAMRAKRSPASFRVMCSRIWALMGRKEDAIRTLQEAVSEGWRPSEGEYPMVTDEPAYGAIRNDPRLKQVDAIIATDIARERRELLAAGP
jgi:TolB-like protein/tetratricopeptide (TPR) repeat protein